MDAQAAANYPLQHELKMPPVLSARTTRGIVPLGVPC